MKTNVYDNFAFFKENRNLNHGLVKRLINSIEKIGYIPGKPILINKHWQIVDGQHRFEACRQLGLPIYYEFMPNGNDMESIIELNRTQEIWRLSEFIDFYAKKGVAEYIYLKKIEEEYHLGISNTIRVVGDSKLFAKQIRLGIRFKINLHTIDIVNFILLLKELDFYLSIHFVGAIVIMWRLTSHIQRDKILKNRMRIPQAPDQVSYLRIFENIINKNTHSDNRIKL